MMNVADLTLKVFLRAEIMMALVHTTFHTVQEAAEVQHWLCLQLTDNKILTFNKSIFYSVKTDLTAYVHPMSTFPPG